MELNVEFKTECVEDQGGRTGYYIIYEKLGDSQFKIICKFRWRALLSEEEQLRLESVRNHLSEKEEINRIFKEGFTTEPIFKSDAMLGTPVNYFERSNNGKTEIC